MFMKRAIVLVSGGMDSLVCAAIAMRDCDEIHFLHANYGQQTEAKELQCFDAISEYYKPTSNSVIDLTWLHQIGGSALTDSALTICDHAEKEGVPNTYVPFRNANLLCAAVSKAEVIQANYIYIGAVEEDSSGYPDCREVFFAAMEKVIETGTTNLFPIKILSPLLHMTKVEIVQMGLELKVPFGLSWSCYRNGEIACGTCDSCFLRLKAFDGAAAIDPIPYKL